MFTSVSKRLELLAISDKSIKSHPSCIKIFQNNIRMWNLTYFLKSCPDLKSPRRDFIAKQRIVCVKSRGNTAAGQEKKIHRKYWRKYRENIKEILEEIQRKYKRNTAGQENKKGQFQFLLAVTFPADFYKARRKLSIYSKSKCLVGILNSWISTKFKTWFLYRLCLESNPPGLDSRCINHFKMNVGKDKGFFFNHEQYIIVCTCRLV